MSFFRRFQDPAESLLQASLATANREDPEGSILEIQKILKAPTFLTSLSLATTGGNSSSTSTATENNFTSYVVKRLSLIIDKACPLDAEIDLMQNEPEFFEKLTLSHLRGGDATDSISALTNNNNNSFDDVLNNMDKLNSNNNNTVTSVDADDSFAKFQEVVSDDEQQQRREKYKTLLTALKKQSEEAQVCLEVLCTQNCAVRDAILSNASKYHRSDENGEKIEESVESTSIWQRLCDIIEYWVRHTDASDSACEDLLSNQNTTKNNNKRNNTNNNCRHHHHQLSLSVRNAIKILTIALDPSRSSLSLSQSQGSQQESRFSKVAVLAASRNFVAADELLFDMLIKGIASVSSVCENFKQALEKERKPVSPSSSSSTASLGAAFTAQGYQILTCIFDRANILITEKVYNSKGSEMIALFLNFVLSTKSGFVRAVVDAFCTSPVRIEGEVNEDEEDSVEAEEEGNKLAAFVALANFLKHKQMFGQSDFSAIPAHMLSQKQQQQQSSSSPFSSTPQNSNNAKSNNNNINTNNTRVTKTVLENGIVFPCVNEISPVQLPTCGMGNEPVENKSFGFYDRGAGCFANGSDDDDDILTSPGSRKKKRFAKRQLKSWLDRILLLEDGDDDDVDDDEDDESNNKSTNNDSFASSNTTNNNGSFSQSDRSVNNNSNNNKKRKNQYYQIEEVQYVTCGVLGPLSRLMKSENFKNKTIFSAFFTSTSPCTSGSRSVRAQTLLGVDLLSLFIRLLTFTIHRISGAKIASIFPDSAADDEAQAETRKILTQFLEQDSSNSNNNNNESSGVAFWTDIIVPFFSSSSSNQPTIFSLIKTKFPSFSVLHSDTIPLLVSVTKCAKAFFQVHYSSLSNATLGEASYQNAILQVFGNDVLNFVDEVFSGGSSSNSISPPRTNSTTPNTINNNNNNTSESTGIVGSASSGSSILGEINKMGTTAIATTPQQQKNKSLVGARAANNSDENPELRVFAQQVFAILFQTPILKNCDESFDMTSKSVTIAEKFINEQLPLIAEASQNKYNANLAKNKKLFSVQQIAASSERFLQTLLRYHLGMDDDDVEVANNNVFGKSSNKNGATNNNTSTTPVSSSVMYSTGISAMFDMGNPNQDDANNNKASEKNNVLSPEGDHKTQPHDKINVGSVIDGNNNNNVDDYKKHPPVLVSSPLTSREKRSVGGKGRRGFTLFGFDDEEDDEDTNEALLKKAEAKLKQSDLHRPTIRIAKGSRETQLSQVDKFKKELLLQQQQAFNNNNLHNKLKIPSIEDIEEDDDREKTKPKPQPQHPERCLENLRAGILFANPSSANNNGSLDDENGKNNCHLQQGQRRLSSDATTLNGGGGGVDLFASLLPPPVVPQLQNNNNNNNNNNTKHADPNATFDDLFGQQLQAQKKSINHDNGEQASISPSLAKNNIDTYFEESPVVALDESPVVSPKPIPNENNNNMNNNNVVDLFSSPNNSNENNNNNGVNLFSDSNKPENSGVAATKTTGFDNFQQQFAKVDRSALKILTASMLDEHNSNNSKQGTKSSDEQQLRKMKNKNGDDGSSSSSSSRSTDSPLVPTVQTPMLVTPASTNSNGSGGNNRSNNNNTSGFENRNENSNDYALSQPSQQQPQQQQQQDLFSNTFDVPASASNKNEEGALDLFGISDNERANKPQQPQEQVTFSPFNIAPTSGNTTQQDFFETAHSNQVVEEDEDDPYSFQPRSKNVLPIPPPPSSLFEANKNNNGGIDFDDLFSNLNINNNKPISSNNNNDNNTVELFPTKNIVQVMASDSALDLFSPLSVPMQNEKTVVPSSTFDLFQIDVKPPQPNSVEVPIVEDIIISPQDIFAVLNAENTTDSIKATDLFEVKNLQEKGEEKNPVQAVQDLFAANNNNFNDKTTPKQQVTSATKTTSKLLGALKFSQKSSSEQSSNISNNNINHATTDLFATELSKQQPKIGELAIATTSQRNENQRPGINQVDATVLFANLYRDQHPHHRIRGGDFIATSPPASKKKNASTKNKNNNNTNGTSTTSEDDVKSIVNWWIDSKMLVASSNAIQSTSPENSETEQDRLKQEEWVTDIFGTKQERINLRTQQKERRGRNQNNGDDDDDANDEEEIIARLEQRGAYVQFTTINPFSVFM